MRRENKFLFGVFTMLFFLLAGVVGTVSAAELDSTATLQMEVKMLQRFNELQLTNEQIDKILPVLKNAQNAYLTAKAEIEKLLNQERDLLVKRKATEAKAIEAQRQVVQQKAALQMQSILLDLKTILTPEQQKRCNFMMGSQMGMGRMAAQPGAPANGMVAPGQPNRVIVIQKPDKPTQDESFTRTEKKTTVVTGEKATQQYISPVVKEMLMEEWQARLQELEGKLATAKAEEKAVIEKEIAEIKAQMERLVSNGNFRMMQNPQQYRTMIEQMYARRMGQSKGQNIAHPMMMARHGKGNGFNKGEMLSTMIKILEEMRKASK